ncbi:MAG: ATP-dependent Clp protease adaptor ClpS [Flavobacteriaceae bacterium]|nr:ATP-dependent Clp protease adaptor ClpS [Flavobacteriaceae bacterium]
MSTHEKVLPEFSEETDVLSLNEIILYNDDVNTFDYVIETLMDVCEHTQEQAHQCSLIVHYKGKCCVKTGTLTELEPRCQQLLDAGLSAVLV